MHPFDTVQQQQQQQKRDSKSPAQPRAQLAIKTDTTQTEYKLMKIENEKVNLMKTEHEK